MGLIYLATNLESGKSYVGLTKHTLEWRKGKHYETSKYVADRTYFHSALLKYDESVWQWIILEDNITDINLLRAREIYWIAFYKAIGVKLYNLTNGGDGTSGYILTMENRAKLSAANTRRKHSPETKAKIAESKKGKTVNAKTFTLVSPDGIATEITNMLQFSRENGLEQSAMTRVANGKRKSAYGWTLPVQ